MRICWIPRVHTTRRITGCSGVNVGRFIFEAAAAEGLALTDCWLPEGADLTGVTQGRGITYRERKIPWPDGHIHGVRDTDNSLLEMLAARQYAADIVFTEYSFASAYHQMIQYEVDHAFNVRVFMPIFSWFSEYVDGAAAYYKLPSAVPLLGVAPFAGGLGFVTDQNKKEFMVEARKVFGGSHLRTLMESPVLRIALDTMYTDYAAILERNLARQDAAPKGEMTIMLVGSGGTVRRWKLLADAVVKARTRGAKIRIKVFSQVKLREDWLDAEHIETFEQVERTELLTHLHEADVAFDATLRQFGGLATHELVLSGAVPVFLTDDPGTAWMRERMPPDYKFAANSEDELAGMLYWLANNWGSDEIRTETKRYRDAAAVSFDQRVVMRQWMKSLGEVVKKNYDPGKFTRGMFGVLGKRLADSAPSAPLSSVDVGLRCKELSDKGTLNPYKLLSAVAFRRFMQSCGFQDVGTATAEMWALGTEEWMR